MDSQDFRAAAATATDDSKYQCSTILLIRLQILTLQSVVNYFNNLGSRDVVSTVEPGYLRGLLPSEAPQEGEPWADIHKDIEAKIMPGITHW